MQKRSFPALAVFLFVAMCFSAGPGAAQSAPAATGVSNGAGGTEVPAELVPYGNSWVPRGTGALRFFGFKAYDATLWGTQGQTPFSFSKPFALDIRYATSVTAKDISNTSLIELQRISSSSPEQIAAWSAFMDAVFVDVKAGDRLVGVHLPSAGARFFHNGKLIGESPDVAFSEAFFKIWLDPKTKRKDLRNALLALPPDSRTQ